MPNLFSTFGRAALVALGLAVAPAAFAQGGTFTCPQGFAPIFTGGGGQSVEATCGVDCGAGNIATIVGNVVSCSAGTPTNVAVSSCTLVQTSPTGSVPAGTAITFTGNCTTGTPSAITTLTWTVTGTGSSKGTCASSATVGTPFTCVVNAGTGGGNVSFSASNGVGSAATKTTSYAVQSGGGGTGDWTACPSNAAKFGSFYPHPVAGVYGDDSTASMGATLGTGAVMSIKMNVTATSGSGGANFLASYGGGRYTTWSVTRTACDFDKANAIQWVANPSKPDKISYLYGQTSSGITPTWTYGSTGLLPVGTYYFNMRIESCDSGDCYYTNVTIK